MHILKLYCLQIFVVYSGIGGYGGCNKDSQEIFWNFMYGHAQTSTAIYDNIKKTCGNSIIMETRQQHVIKYYMHQELI